MSRRYTDREEETVYALLCDGLGLTAIQRLIRDDAAGLGYRREIPYSSLKAIRKRMVAKHGNPRPIVAVDKELEAVSAARRRAVSLLVAQVNRISDRKATNPDLTPNEDAQLRRIEEHLAGIEKRQKRSEPAQSKESQRAKKGHETRAANGPSFLERIAQEISEPAELPPHLSEPAPAPNKGMLNGTNGDGATDAETRPPSSAPRADEQA